MKPEDLVARAFAQTQPAFSAEEHRARAMALVAESEDRRKADDAANAEWQRARQEKLAAQEIEDLTYVNRTLQQVNAAQRQRIAELEAKLRGGS